MESGLAARNGGRIGLAALVAILLLGVGLRLSYAWDGREPVYDARAYAAIAANLERGEGFTVGPEATQPSSNYSPGLPLLVAGLYEVGGGVDERAARVVLAVIASLAVGFAYLIGRRLAAPVAGLVAAAVVAVYPAFLEYGGMLMSEPLAATLLSGAILALLRAGDPALRSAVDSRGDIPSKRQPHPLVWRRWLLAGVALGGLALVRPEYLAIAVLLALLVFLRPVRIPLPRAELRRSFAAALVVLAGIAVVVVPWTVRNAVALDRFVPISTGGGQVLFAGTYLPSDGDPEKVGAEVVAENPDLFAPAAAERLRLEQILARLGEARYPELEPDQALSRLGREQLWDDITEHPGEYAGFVATKVGRIWSHGPRQIMRTPVWEAVHWALIALGLAGLALLAWRRRWEALVIGAVFLAITLLSALLVASPRRVLVLVPLLAACAGYAVASIADQRLTYPRPPSQKRPSTFETSA